jgi:glycosyltransferase involved in cell wall biosynthesis
MSDLSCSVIVATYNRSALLQKLLASLAKQDIGPAAFELIIVDDGSQDDTPAFLESVRLPFKFRHKSQANQGPAAARNEAIADAKSDLIVSLDDDVMAAPDLLRQHIRAHQGKERLAAMGVMLVPPEKQLRPWLQWEAVTLDKQYQQLRRGDWGATPRQFYTANASFGRREAIYAGLFDTSFRRAEDIEFAYRLQDQGGTFQFLPNAVVHHDPNRTYTEWLRVPLQYGHYDVIMGRDKGRRSVLMHAAWDYSRRRTALKVAAHALIGRRRLVRGFNATAAAIASGASALSMPRISRAAYSAIFNLQYWQGLSEGLGSRQAFWSLTDTEKQPRVPASS